MSEIISYQSAQLPDTLEDLSKFVLVNEERSQALRAQIRAIKKVNLAREVYEQKLAEAQEIGDLTVEAAQKMGELLLQIQKQQGHRTDLTSPTKAEKSKTEITKEMGMTSQQVSQYQQMAQNPQAVEIAKQKARENDDIVSRSQVMKEIAEEKKRSKALEDENRRLREAVSQQGAENVILKKKLENVPVKEVVKEVTVEVVPDDYESIKKSNANLRSEISVLGKDRENAIERCRVAEEELDSLKKKMNEPEEKAKYETRLNCVAFCTGVKSFLEKYGGYKFRKDEISALPEIDRNAYEHAIKEMRKWLDEMLDEVTVEV